MIKRIKLWWHCFWNLHHKAQLGTCGPVEYVCDDCGYKP